MNRMQWSKAEKLVARRAFDTAYRRECEAVAARVREMIGSMEEPDDLWAIHGYLSRRRRAVDRKYDYRYSVLIHVFATLVGEGWLTWEDLEGLEEEKLERIRRVVAALS